MCRHPCGASELPRGTKDPIEIPSPPSSLPDNLLVLCATAAIFILGSCQRVSICTTFILDPSSIFVFVKFKHATQCIWMIETFSDCDVQTFCVCRVFCAARYPNIPRDCKERQIFEAFTVCLDEDEDVSEGICDKVESYKMKMKMISKASNFF